MSDKMYKRMRRKIREERPVGTGREDQYREFKYMYRRGWKLLLAHPFMRQGPTIWSKR